MSNYNVKPGDTLYRLAIQNGMTVEELKACNNLTGDTLKVGQILHFAKNDNTAKQISVVNEISDKQIEQNNYIKLIENPDYQIKLGDNLSQIAKRYGVEVISLQKLNSIKENEVLKLGRTIKIPPTKIVKNIKNLNDVSKALMVSKDFVSSIKRIEDGISQKTHKEYSDNEFHNTPYIDNAGVKTIGIGHAMKVGDKEKLSNKEVLELYTKDLIKIETHLEEILGVNVYKNLPEGMREALLDMVFNKGDDILNQNLIWCVKNGKYEAAINQMTNVQSVNTKEEMSGLCKRRLFDISRAITDFNGDIPKSNIETIKMIYSKGLALLRKECNKSNASFENLKVGFDEDIKKYFGNLYESIF